MILLISPDRYLSIKRRLDQLQMLPMDVIILIKYFNPDAEYKHH